MTRTSGPTRPRSYLTHYPPGDGMEADTELTRLWRIALFYFGSGHGLKSGFRVGFGSGEWKKAKQQKWIMIFDWCHLETLNPKRGGNLTSPFAFALNRDTVTGPNLQHLLVVVVAPAFFFFQIYIPMIKKIHFIELAERWIPASVIFCWGSSGSSGGGLVGSVVPVEFSSTIHGSIKSSQRIG